MTRVRNVLVIHAHPDPDSFSAALRTTAVDALAAAGHRVELIDLYQSQYEPAMTEQEHLGYYRNGAAHPDPVVADHITRLKAADTLVFIYPTWWSGLPAVMKGWLDRTMLPGVAFNLSGTDPETGEPRGAVTPALTNITRLIGITTYGSGPVEVRLLGDAGKRTVTRTIRLTCARRCRTTWLSLHRLDTSTPEERARFLDRVTTKLGGLR